MQLLCLFYKRWCSCMCYCTKQMCISRPSGIHMRRTNITPTASCDSQTRVACRWAHSRITAGAGRSGTAHSGTPCAPSSRARRGPGRRRSHQRCVLAMQIAVLQCMQGADNYTTPFHPCLYIHLVCCSLCADSSLVRLAAPPMAHVCDCRSPGRRTCTGMRTPRRATGGGPTAGGAGAAGAGRRTPSTSSPRTTASRWRTWSPTTRSTTRPTASATGAQARWCLSSSPVISGAATHGCHLLLKWPTMHHALYEEARLFPPANAPPPLAEGHA